MKKSILLVVMLVIVMLLCCACRKIEDIKPKNTEIENTIFKKYCDEDGGIVIVDTETNVMYWLSTAVYNYGSLTLLVNEDGTPKLYQEQNTAER